MVRTPQAPFGKPDDAGSLSVLGGSLVSTGAPFCDA